MVFETVEPNVCKFEKDGDSTEGILIEKKEDVGVNKSRMYYLEKDGNPVKVWGSTVLDDRMDFVKIGSYVKITFKGTTPNKRGQDLKIYKVEVDKEKSLRVPSKTRNDGGMGNGETKVPEEKIFGL